MSDWLRWLIVALAIVLIVVMIGYARGERQRGEDIPESAGAVSVVTTGSPT